MKSIRNIVSLFILITLLIVTGCKKPERLDDSKFKQVYIDLIITEDTTSGSNFREIVFKRQGVTEDIYNKTVDFYKKNPKKFQAFFEEVEKEINKIQ